MSRQDLSLSNPQKLICQKKTQPTKSFKPYKCVQIIRVR